MFVLIVMLLSICRLKNFSLYIGLSIFLIFGFPSYLTLSYGFNIQKIIAVIFLIELLVIFLGNFKINVVKIPIAIFIFALVMSSWLVSSVFSDAYQGVLVRALAQIVLYFGVFAYLNYHFRQGSLTVDILCKSLIAAFILNFPVAIYEQFSRIPVSNILMAYFGSQTEGWGFILKEKFRLVGYRSQGFMVHPLAYALLSMVAYISAITVIRNSNKSVNLKLLFFVTAFLIFAYSIFISGSRSGLGAFLVITLFLSTYRNLTIQKLSVLLSLLSILCFYLLFSDFKLLTKLVELATGSGEFSALSNSNAVRFQQYSEAYAALNSSILVGHGVDSSIHFTEFGTMDNFWLSWMVNYGLIGMITLFVIIGFKMIYVKNIVTENRKFFYSIGLTFLCFSPILSLSYLTLILFLFLSIEGKNIRVNRLESSR